jgi:hypothetical protein
MAYHSLSFHLLSVQNTDEIAGAPSTILGYEEKEIYVADGQELTLTLDFPPPEEDDSY